VKAQLEPIKFNSLLLQTALPMFGKSLILKQEHMEDYSLRLPLSILVKTLSLNGVEAMHALVHGLARPF